MMWQTHRNTRCWRRQHSQMRLVTFSFGCHHGRGLGLFIAAGPAPAAVVMGYAAMFAAITVVEGLAHLGGIIGMPVLHLGLRCFEGVPTAGCR